MQFSSIDANLLVILDPLLRTQSVSEAAAVLHLSPSATSHALGRLRELLGDPLLVRAGRSLVRTPRGEALAPIVAAAVLAMNRVLIPSPDFQPTNLERTFHLLYAGYHDWVLIPALDRLLRKEAPGVRLHSHTSNTSPTIQLRDGRVDLAFLLRSELPPEAHTHLLPEDPFVSLVRKGHPCTKEPLSVERFAAMEHFLISPMGGSTGTVDIALEALGLTRTISRIFTNFLPAPHLIAHSDAILTIPESVARLAMKLFDLDPVHVPLDIPSVELFLVWHPRNHTDPAHQWFREHVIQCIYARKGLIYENAVS